MAFSILPIELNKEILSYLETDRDICNFRSVCKSTYYAVDGDGGSFWRRRFLDHFDPPGRKVSSIELKRAYQTRKKVLRRHTHIRRGDTNGEIEYLNVLRDLINESYNGKVKPDSYGRTSCLNLNALRHFVYSTNILYSVDRDDESEPKDNVLPAIQLMCAHLSFDDRITPYGMLGFEDSQIAVYSTSKTMPIFKGFNNLEVNFNWVLHVFNFFRYHMLREAEMTLYDDVRMLTVLERMAPWKGKLDAPKKLGERWMGTYSYLERHEIPRIRAMAPNGGNSSKCNSVFLDKNVDGESPLQTLMLDFPEQDNMVWPEIFERNLNSHPDHKSPKTRAQRRYEAHSNEKSVSFRFQGSGYDDNEDFYAAGWLNPLPPQYGIPGWQRMTMMKFFVDDNDVLDTDALWAYEGVVLPGGQLILGRWWAVDEDASDAQFYCGPFIFWNIDDSNLECGTHNPF